jgi:S1-C subfamily serine protease
MAGWERAWWACASALLAGSLTAAQATTYAESVVQIRAISRNGNVTLGSGVMTEHGQVATACHCTRGAATIEIVHGAKRWIAEQTIGSEHHDICVLSARGLDVPRAVLRASTDLRPGEAVTAVGFEGGEKIVARAGRVAALYAYDNGNVIRTTAAFDFGSSGGGLFDEAGHLVGVLAFRARTGEDLRFALPSEWLRTEGGAAKLAPLGPNATAPAFWEQSRDERPSFLGAALKEAASR